MARVPIDFLNEVRSGHLSMLLLARVAELSLEREKRPDSDSTHTQSLFEYAADKLGTTSSTCYTRLRLLRVGGYLEEESGVRKGKGVVGYSITSEGKSLLRELLREAVLIVGICQEISGEKE